MLARSRFNLGRSRFRPKFARHRATSGCLDRLAYFGPYFAELDRVPSKLVEDSIGPPLADSGPNVAESGRPPHVASWSAPKSADSERFRVPSTRMVATCQVDYHTQRPARPYSGMCLLDYHTLRICLNSLDVVKPHTLGLGGPSCDICAETPATTCSICCGDRRLSQACRRVAAGLPHSARRPEF